MSENFGVDFIARCMAGEALEQSKSKAWTIVAGNSISVLSDEEEKTDTIGLDGTLPTDVNASVSNSQLTIQLEDENGTAIGSGSTVNLPSGLPPSTSADEGKVLTVNSSGNAEWDESEATILRTAYVPLAATDYVKTKVNDNKYNVVFDAPVGFELLEARISYSITFTCGSWVDATLTFSDTLSIPSSVGSTPREGRKIYTQKLADHYSSDATPVHYNQMVDEITGANFIYYDEQTGKITLEIGNLTAPYVEYISGYPENTEVVISDLTITSLGYVAFGADNVNITTGIIGGTGIDVDGNVISLDANYGASFELSINSSTYVLTATLKDQNGNTLGTPQTVDLPLETMVVSGSYDDTTKKIILTLQNGQTIEFSVADLVDGLETSTHAAATYQTIAGMSNYATQTDIADMATQTWVGQQGFLTTQEQADWTESDNTDPAYIKNKPNLAAVATSGSYTDLSNTPTIPAAQVNSDWNASSGVAQILNKPNLATVATSGSYTDLSNTPDLSDMATQTWVGQQGFLTSADEVPTVGSTDDGKVLTADYTGGTGSYSWETIPTPADMATQTWVGQQGYLTSADEVPAVGSTDDGKILTASYTGGVGSYSWETAPSGLPASTSADEGKVLIVDSQGDAGWGVIPDKSGIYGSIMYADDSDTFVGSIFSLQNPLDIDMDGSGNTQATDGDVLTWDSTDQIMKWQAPSSGGLQVETDGTNYWITVNNIRLYFASSEPSAPAGGSIPDGSIGIGW